MLFQILGAAIQQIQTTARVANIYSQDDQDSDQPPHVQQQEEVSIPVPIVESPITQPDQTLVAEVTQTPSPRPDISTQIQNIMPHSNPQWIKLPDWHTDFDRVCLNKIL